MPKPLPETSIITALLDYDPSTGLFVWRTRSVEWFRDTPRRSAEWQCAWWNTRFASAQAGTLDPYRYIVIRVLGIDYRAHRLAWAVMTGETPIFIDHINGVRDDNRFVNLRSVAHSDNTKNAKRRIDNTAGVTGVSYFAPKGTWRARINDNRKTILLGYFRTKEEAIAARKAAEKVYAYHKNHGRDSDQ
jgi:hypothetical protein